MNDVLKQVEEALVMHQLHLKHHHVTYLGFGYDAERQEQFAAREYVMSDKTDSALTALRGLEWKPIDSDMVFTEKVSVGKWFKLLNRWKWVTSDGWQSLKAAKMGGYTHFCRPVLPTPPKREVE
jgi:hypothetical protein